MSSTSRRALIGLLLLAISALPACESFLPTPLYDLDGDFFDAPFPSLERSSSSGSPDWSGFPNPYDSPLLDTYLQHSKALDGGSTVGPVYFRFSRRLDTSSLPTPGESLSLDSPVFLVGVDPSAPDRGVLLPLQWSWQEDETTYQAKNLLAIAPASGVPLRPRTTYAVVITTDIAHRSAAFSNAMDPGHPSSELFSPLKDTLVELGVSREQVAIASIFRTQDPVSEMAEWAWWVRNNIPAATWDGVLSPTFETSHFHAWTGELDLPLFQHGEKPYTLEGGSFLRDEQGDPDIADWETVPFTLTVPAGESPPADGWPVVIWSHGTGGDHDTCCNGDGDLEAARVLALGGMALLATPQPLHGARSNQSTIPELHSFNPMNPAAARTNFRQGALDLVYLARSLSGRQQRFVLDGETHSLDPERVLLMGHSHGGLTGAIAGPFLGDLVKAGVLSAAGGGMSTTLTLRTDPVNLEGIVREALEFASDETVHALHPVSALIQTVTDATDPLNYARYWHREADWFTNAPIGLLMTTGEDDALTPPETSLALAAAGGLPLLEPVSWTSEPHENAGIPSVALPTSQNLGAYDGSRPTGGLAQLAGDGHYAVFNNVAAAQLYRHYLETASENAAILKEFDGASR